MRRNAWCSVCLATKSFREIGKTINGNVEIEMECPACGHNIALLMSKEEYKKLASKN